MPEHDLGLLSDVATLLDPALIDPALLPSASREQSGGSTAIPTGDSVVQLPQASAGGYLGDITVGAGLAPSYSSQHGHQHALDPSLQNLSNELELDPSFLYTHYGDEYAHATPDAMSAQGSRLGDHQRNDPEEDSFVLEPAPQDPAEQVNQLREMDEQATRSLVANRAYQAELRSLMERFEAASKRTTELKTFVRNLSAELLAGAEMKIVAPGTAEPVLPWFKHHHGRDLPMNPDAEARERYLEATRFWPWSAGERAKLAQEVMSNNHRRIAQEAAANGEDMEEKLASIDPNWYRENTEGLDWEMISLVLKRRSPLSCKMQWMQHDHPSLNFKKFSKDEMSRMIEMVDERGMQNWEEIAKELGNGRVGWDCLKKYRARPGQRIDWTAAEDQALRDAVREYGENWQIVARVCGTHSNACINRWTKSLKPTIKRGKWSPEEDEALKTAIGLVGKNWKEVAPRVSGRTDAQCRERWTNALDPVLDHKKPWLPEEDQMLLEAKESGKSWIEISRECFHGIRTDNKCMRRYQDLTKPVKAKSKKGKKKRLPKETDEEDNADLDAAADDSDAASAGGSRGSHPPPARKRPRREVQHKVPQLGQVLGMEDFEMGDLVPDPTQAEADIMVGFEDLFGPMTAGSSAARANGNDPGATSVETGPATEGGGASASTRGGRGRGRGRARGRGTTRGRGASNA
ncbi:uncharacterized protein JCM15063_005132 [Sporobolomyces koalae]|uniref:uncharacterized protein n=1 Tax=Sporobolomyces koalae TaxID=500713 RepID=UPI0031761FB8